MKVGSRRHANTHLPWGSDPLLEIPATGLSWSANQSGGDSVPSQAPGSFTRLNADPSALFTTDSGMFTIEPATIDDVYGLAIHEVGTYFISYSTLFSKPTAGFDTSILDITVQSGEGGAFDILVPSVLGWYSQRGVRFGPSQNAWSVSWADLIVMNADSVSQTTANPIVNTAQQETGIDLDVYFDVFAVQISTETFGF